MTSLLSSGRYLQISAILLLLSFIAMQVTARAQTYPDPGIDSRLKYGINKIILQDYPEAASTFADLDKSFPEIPLGKIYLAAVKIARAYDYGIPYDKNAIDSLLGLAIDQSHSLLEAGGKNPWNKYFLSLSEGYLAYFKALDNEWLSSLSYGADALTDFSELAQSDSNFFEAYIAIGAYKYWKSRRTEFLEWIPGYIDEKEEGIRLLERAMIHSSYNSYLAVNSLIWIYIDQKKYYEAGKLAEDVLKKYTGSRFFEWGLGRAYEEIDHVKAIKVYERMLDSLPKNLNHFNEITLMHLIAQQYAAIGEYKKAIHLCNRILAISLNEEVRSKLESRLKRVEELRKQLLN